MFASQFLPRFVTTGFLGAFVCFGGGDAANALYDVGPGEIPGKPGSIIRVWPLEGGGPGMGGMGDAFRILYRSTDPSGRPIPVSGAIYIPNGPAPAGGRNIIAWAHPTSGVMPPCAPSLMPDVGGMMWNLPNMITQGYIVVATDYPGLGTEGIHPYLIGESEARSVLDSVRAARDLPNTGASNRFAVWGHSQGGHAALYTGEVAARYAPELKLVGVAAAAPATYLVELFDADESTAQDLVAMSVLSWTRWKTSR
jgi:acetyl esterase/lipase